jgi:hypothetical protein
MSDQHVGAPTAAQSRAVCTISSQVGLVADSCALEGVYHCTPHAAVQAFYHASAGMMTRIMMQVLSRSFGDDEDLALVPFVDFCNHYSRADPPVGCVGNMCQKHLSEICTATQPNLHTMLSATSVKASSPATLTAQHVPSPAACSSLVIPDVGYFTSPACPLPWTSVAAVVMIDTGRITPY